MKKLRKRSQDYERNPAVGEKYLKILLSRFPTMFRSQVMLRLMINQL